MTPTSGAQSGLDKLAVLRNTQLFGGIAEPILKEVAGSATSRHLQPGQVLVSENEEALALYLVVRGELRSIRQSASGREQVLSTEGPGAVLAAAPMFNGGKFYSTIIADSASDVLCIEKDQMRQLCSKHPELLWNVARVMAQKLRHYADLIETLAQRMWTNGLLSIRSASVKKRRSKTKKDVFLNLE
jgi:CRP/FNR family transcriptional regulator, cyclic AMP receptor protein